MDAPNPQLRFQLCFRLHLRARLRKKNQVVPKEDSTIAEEPFEDFQSKQQRNNTLRNQCHRHRPPSTPDSSPTPGGLRSPANSVVIVVVQELEDSLANAIAATLVVASATSAQQEPS